ncbi:L-arabinose isomerase [Deltaproteobacteria bacterium Smac51]|nr:L-arabinose isomerase [Deltaproteobacteria bacterium Smac51]
MKTKTERKPAIWFVVGSQHLYGPAALKEVEADSKIVAEGLNAAGFPLPIILKPMVTRADEITAFCKEANYDDDCLGVITWMHTFSPAKMWATGLKLLEKPMLQLHTQLSPELPWDKINMDFMNLHQTAHGGREFGHISARLKKPFSVAVGHWKEERVTRKVDLWMRVCLAINESRNLKVARFGDNMRDVAVTEGDKVEALIRLGFTVDAFTSNDLAEVLAAVTDEEVKATVADYEKRYILTDVVRAGGSARGNLEDSARLEVALRRFLEQGGYRAFTTNFEALSGLKQLPGLAAQRLMADGYGFGAEGDWKTSALTRILKVMGQGREGGASFMEDYTYHFGPEGDLNLGAHMLEVCPTLAGKTKPVLDVQPLGIGGKEAPARLLFSCRSGPAVNVGIMDLGGRFRIVINEIDVIEPPHDLPKLPVARAVWKYRPDFETGVAAWIVAGGGHHTVLSLSLTAEHIRTFADELGLECLVIGSKTDLDSFKNELRWNDLYYRDR